MALSSSHLQQNSGSHPHHLYPNIHQVLLTFYLWSLSIDFLPSLLSPHLATTMHLVDSYSFPSCLCKGSLPRSFPVARLLFPKQTYDSLLETIQWHHLNLGDRCTFLHDQPLASQSRIHSSPHSLTHPLMNSTTVHVILCVRNYTRPWGLDERNKMNSCTWPWHRLMRGPDLQGHK